jgi:mRNA-degrading endonuclease toxin of MazEF toxin-antitoxin module
VKCEHLITLHERFVGRVIGRLPPEIMQKVDQRLRESLALA